MTTIAWDGDIVACDSMATRRDTYSGDTQKVILLENKIILSLTGSLKMFGVILPYIKNIYFDKKEDFIKTSEYFKGDDDNWFELAVFYLEETEDEFLGQICYDTYTNSLVPVTNVKSKFYVSGSGCDIALGAMMAGASAIKAVSLAAEVDIYTGGNITSYSTMKNLKTIVKPNYSNIIYKGQ